MKKLLFRQDLQDKYLGKNLVANAMLCINRFEILLIMSNIKEKK